MGSNFNIVKKPEKDEDEYEEEVENVELDEDKDKGKSKSDDPKTKMLMLMGIIAGGVLLLFIILYIASLFNKKTYTFENVEQIMETAAVSYFKDHPEYLPENDGDGVELEVVNLIAEKKMKDLSYYTGVEGCTGKVVVEKYSGEYVYSPYLNCGSVYTTYELYKKVLEDNNTVTSGDGLYATSNGYAFRGENVKNYVQLENSVWRIVKITNDGNVVLISDKGSKYSQPWDNRYNETRYYESGINDFTVSRIKDFLNKLYTNPNPDDGEDIISNSDRGKIDSYKVCIGKRTMTSEGKNNVEECKQTMSNQKLGLLTLSDYLYASLDPNCKTASTKSCQNYNYLTDSKDCWLITADASNTSTVYKVDQNGVVNSAIASTYAMVRPVIYLKSNVFIKEGEGTLEKPYT